MKHPLSPLAQQHAELTQEFDSARVRLTVPEGIDLSFHVATYGDRLRVLLVDFGIQTVLQALIAYVTYRIVNAAWAEEMLRPVLITAGVAFLVPLLYAPICQRFLYGRSLGMYLNGVRIVRTDGGHLTAVDTLLRSAFALPIYLLPWAVMMTAYFVWPGQYGWVIAFALALSIAYALVGVLTPLTQGLPDLAMQTMLVKETRPRPYIRVSESEASGRHHFEPAQLALYGTYELHVLEELLCNAEQLDGELIAIAAHAISAKCAISPETIDNPRVFVTDFYLALRRDLAAAMRAGRTRHRKQARGLRR